MNKTAEEVLKSKLTIEAIVLNKPDYTFNKVLEAMEEYKNTSTPKWVRADERFPGKGGSDIHERTPEQEQEELVQWLQNEKYQPEINLWIEVAKEFHFDKPFHETVRAGIIQRLISKGFTINQNQSTPSPTRGLPDTIEIISQELSKDKSEGSYYHGWQSNIAMAFIDETRKFIKGLFDESFGDGLLHTVANNAAKNFLDTHLATLPNKSSGDDWISVEDGNELPDYDVPVLWLQENGNMVVDSLDKDGNPWIFEAQKFEGTYLGNKATHWRPLPPAPDKK